MWPYLSPIADLLMITASGAAGLYCLILSRRLSRLTSFDKGIGSAIAVLSAQVDDMKAALAEAKTGTDGAGAQLLDLVRQAREISGELELMIAACHDFAEQALVTQDGAVPGQGGAGPAVSGPQPLPVPPDLVGAATPIFGTRRQPPVEPVFRRHAQG